MTPFLMTFLLALQPFKPTISVAPRTAIVGKGTSMTFHARINYEPGGPRYMRQPVKWTVEEGMAGGSVSIQGLYTAPSTPGTFHVKAEREDHPGVSARATVKVI